VPTIGTSAERRSTWLPVVCGVVNDREGSIDQFEKEGASNSRPPPGLQNDRVAVAAFERAEEPPLGLGLRSRCGS
jgi:hypothetical protein